MIDVNVIEYYKIWWFVIYSKIVIAVDVKICSFSWSAMNKSWLLYCFCCTQQMYVEQVAINV